MSSIVPPVIPAICIDSPCGAGGTSAAKAVAKATGFKLLMSGDLYRATAWKIRQMGYRNEPGRWQSVAAGLNIEYVGDEAYIDRVPVSKELRSPEITEFCSIVAQSPLVRAELLKYQRSCRIMPGMVAEGRDMCEIFEEPMLRVFITAMPEVRAERRCEQIRKAGGSANYEDILRSILKRDSDDMSRAVSPLRQHPKAEVIHSDGMTEEEVLELILFLATREGIIKQPVGA